MYFSFLTFRGERQRARNRKEIWRKKRGAKRLADKHVWVLVALLKNWYIRNCEQQKTNGAPNKASKVCCNESSLAAQLYGWRPHVWSPGSQIQKVSHLRRFGLRRGPGCPYRHNNTRQCTSKVSPKFLMPLITVTGSSRAVRLGRENEHRPSSNWPTVQISLRAQSSVVRLAPLYRGRHCCDGSYV